MDKHLKMPIPSFPRRRDQTAGKPFYHAKQPEGLGAGEERQSILNISLSLVTIFGLLFHRLVDFSQHLKPKVLIRPVLTKTNYPKSVLFKKNAHSNYPWNRDFSRAKPNKTTGLKSRFLLKITPTENTSQNHKWKALPTLLILIVLSACTEQNPTLNIAVASNFEQTLKKIIQQYPNKQYKINIIAGSSGVLTNQILNNAPYDLFLSADAGKPQLIAKKLNLKTKPAIYAIGKLALWIPGSTGKQCLQKLAIAKTLAIANPKTAPYGKAAQGILNKNNIKIEKIIQTANASQAYIYTKDRLTQAGFVPYTLAMNETKGCLEVFENKELNQGMILLNDKAKEFYDFMRSTAIKNLIEKSGYQ